MEIDKIEPQYKNEKFTCPHCHNYALQHWDLHTISKINPPGTNAFDFSIKKQEFFSLNKYSETSSFFTGVENIVVIEKNEISRNLGISTCSSCNKMHIWLDNKMIDPRSKLIDKPNKDMNEDIKSLYNEAAEVFDISPKSSGALLRLALENYLRVQLKLKGDDIDSIIGGLLRDKIISENTQKGLDIIRIYGNNGVHPGKINLDEKKENVKELFDIFNIIVKQTSSDPQIIGRNYETVPKNGISKRDCKE